MRGSILLVTYLLLLTKFVWNKFERALLGPPVYLRGWITWKQSIQKNGSM